jgi:glucose-6-phosphate 1-epimerase
MSDFNIPGHVQWLDGGGGLQKVRIDTPWSHAELYLHGAHLTHFQKNGEEPLLFMSAASEFHPDKPIRGGVPLVFPWFGGREGLPAHGFARTSSWDLTAVDLAEDSSVCIRLALPPRDGLDIAFIVTVADSLKMELVVRNDSARPATFESCLHTYFLVSKIDDISIHGLAGTSFIDKLLDATFLEGDAPIRISAEVDRIYTDTSAPVEIEDPGFGRVIRVAKSGSHSTVVWNPWVEKSKRMPDFGDGEYPHMVCVESGNIGKNSILLPPGEAAVLKVEITSTATSGL